MPRALKRFMRKVRVSRHSTLAEGFQAAQPCIDRAGGVVSGPSFPERSPLVSGRKDSFEFAPLIRHDAHRSAWTCGTVTATRLATIIRAAPLLTKWWRLVPGLSRPSPKAAGSREIFLIRVCVSIIFQAAAATWLSGSAMQRENAGSARRMGRRRRMETSTGMVQPNQRTRTSFSLLRCADQP